MKSPFPGMDPFLEDPAFWPDFHSRFVNVWCEKIADLLPGNYSARLDENIYLCEDYIETKSMRQPDVLVTRPKRRKSTGAKSQAGGVATLEPVVVPLKVWLEFRQTYIKLIHRPSRDLIAVCELLSPANKNAPGKQDYWAKRNDLIRQNVHIVELDLLLNGERVQDPLPGGDYFYLVSRSDKRPQCEAFGWNKEKRLPSVPIPLQKPDADVLCDLSKAFATAYERGRYQKEIDYRQLPLMKLNASQTKWIRQQTRGSRAGGAT